MKARLLSVLVVAAIVVLLEALCLAGKIDRMTMQAPHLIARDLWRMLASGELNGAIYQTLSNAFIAFASAMVIGVAFALVIHGFPAIRETLDPLFSIYYAIPVLAFYPLFIVILGLGDGPQIMIGFLMSVVAVIVNTLNGLDRVPRVLRKLAKAQRLRRLETVWRITLPSAWPYVLTGAKLAVSYSLIGVIASEFIMSRGGMGYEISFSYNNFDNAKMYPLILLVMAAAITINVLLFSWERRLLLRRGLK
ncbi:ABC transporter permease [Terrarubrum flagellatum]|uniref:ABC transporter permease n=1 Tax=Terrirubrum flagellatum TaxID=2895980 RepID=UPI00314533ED